MCTCACVRVCHSLFFLSNYFYCHLFCIYLIFADDVATLAGTSVSKVLVDCQALDGTTVLGTPLSFYPWSTTVQLQLSQTSLGSAGGFACSLPPYQTAQIDVQATLTNSETNPSQIQANIYSLVRDKVHIYVRVHIRTLCTFIVLEMFFSFHCIHTSHTDVHCDFCMYICMCVIHTYILQMCA